MERRGDGFVTDNDSKVYRINERDLDKMAKKTEEVKDGSHDDTIRRCD